LAKKHKKLARIINKYGIFNFTRFSENFLSDFEIDYEIILSKEIKEDIKTDVTIRYKIS